MRILGGDGRENEFLNRNVLIEPETINNVDLSWGWGFEAMKIRFLPHRTQY
jgi:hypothetical protein